MKRTVLTFGLLSGAVISALMLLTMKLHDAVGFESAGLILGYTTMVLAFLLIFFGVRSYRDKVAGGTVRFGRAFVVGALIGLVSSLCYAATWEVVYARYMPDFMEKYSAHELEKAREAGATPEALAKKQAEMAKFNAQYHNPAFRAAMTLAEPLPVALIVSLVTATVLSRRRRVDPPAAA